MKVADNVMKRGIAALTNQSESFAELPLSHKAPPTDHCLSRNEIWRNRPQGRDAVVRYKSKKDTKRNIELCQKSNAAAKVGIQKVISTVLEIGSAFAVTMCLQPNRFACDKIGKRL